MKRLKEDMGADAVKILLYYAPNDTVAINDLKSAFIERVGAECDSYDIPFFCEFIVYDANGADEKGLEFAKQKPGWVTAAMKEFSQDKYKIDVLKVEVPINPIYVEGSVCFKGEAAYTRKEALDHFRRAADVATKPFIYLSAGVANNVFIENLAMAAESGTDYSGVLCGRATWQDGIKVYGQNGGKALEDWLGIEGLKNLAAVNAAIASASPGTRKLVSPLPSSAKEKTVARDVSVPLSHNKNLSASGWRRWRLSRGRLPSIGWMDPLLRMSSSAPKWMQGAPSSS